MIFSLLASALPGDKVSCQPLICITFIISRYLLLLSSSPPPSTDLRSNKIFLFKQFLGAAGKCCDDAAGETVDMEEILSVACHRNVLSVLPSTTSTRVVCEVYHHHQVPSFPLVSHTNITSSIVAMRTLKLMGWSWLVATTRIKFFQLSLCFLSRQSWLVKITSGVKS